MGRREAVRLGGRAGGQSALGCSCIGLAYSLPNETRTIAWTVESVRAPIDAVCIDRAAACLVTRALRCESLARC
jgi:hypothetical protein